MQSLADAWAALAMQPAKKGEFRVMQSGVAAAEGGALLAYDSAGLPHLLIPIRSSGHVGADTTSSGVHIEGRELVSGDALGHFVDVSCRKAHLAEVFAHLAGEILAMLPADPGRPATVAKRVLSRWRELLERERPGLLGDQELVGLFGELLVLVKLAEHNPAAVNSWTGPDRVRFDFQRGGLCLEVKTTLSTTQRIIHVHGVDQLEPRPTEELYVVVVGLEKVNAAGASIPDLLERLSALGVDALLLSDRLQRARYSEFDREYYSQKRFKVHRESYFRVDAAFPRIVRSTFAAGDVPAKVGELRYAVDLTSPPPEELPQTRVEQLLLQLSG